MVRSFADAIRLKLEQCHDTPDFWLKRNCCAVEN
jgi:hypothetical protein